MKGLGLLQQEPIALLGKWKPSGMKCPLPAHLREWGWREGGKANHSFLWIKLQMTTQNTLASKTISLPHCFRDVRLYLLAATKAKLFSLPNIWNRIVLFIITVNSYWKAPATTVSGCNFIPVFHGRTPWLSGNHGVLTVPQRKRQIQDTSSAAVDGQLLWTTALFISKPQALSKSCFPDMILIMQIGDKRLKKQALSWDGVNNPTCAVLGTLSRSPPLSTEKPKAIWFTLLHDMVQGFVFLQHEVKKE